MQHTKLSRLASLVGMVILACSCSVAQNYRWSATVSGVEEQVTKCTRWLAGGDCYSTSTVWDSGTVSFTANGQTISTSYGSGSTAVSLAQALCSQMTSSFAVQCSGVLGSGTDWATIGGSAGDGNVAYQVSGSSTTRYTSDINGPRGPSFDIYDSANVSGFVNPKYVILGVTYAPPGSASKVTYANSTTLGTGSSLSNSFAAGVGYSVSVSTTLGGKIGGVFGWNDTVTSTVSSSFTNETDSSSSVAVSSTTAWQTTVPGPKSDYVGVDHDYDVIWLWLNPLTNFTIDVSQPSHIMWTGYSFDADDINEMDIYGVYLGWLTGNLSSPGPGSSDFTPLQRNWAAMPSNGQIWPAGTSPSLINPTDYAAIAAADPFSNPNYTVTIPSGSLTSSDGRFTLTGNQVVDYVQPPPGGQPYTQQLTESTSTTQTAGQGAKYTFGLGYSWEEKFSASFFESSWSQDVKLSDTLTWTDQWSTTNSKANVNSATGSVTGPACIVSGSTCNPVYTGPTQFEVFQDNVYGTFMFYPKY